ncbi:MAG TPA: RDD family protein, partial [Gammaproteobacteria bacterium]
AYTNMNISHISYPRILRRVQGAFIDGVVIPMTAIGSVVILSYAGVESGYLKVGAAAFFILLLEPVAVSLTGGSVGHHFVGMRVRRLSEDSRLNLAMALVRFLVKTAVGIPAFFVAFLTRRRQGLHDLIARSVVVHKNVEGLPQHQSLPELTLADEHKVYASVWRRLLVIATYWLLSFIIWAVITSFIVLPLCSQSGVCTDGEAYGLLALFALFIVMVVAVAILGWKGFLYGCRKQVTNVA